MKSIDHAIRKTAIEHNLPEDKVKFIVQQYWAEVSDNLITLKSTTIAIRKIGVFTISRFKLNNLIRKKIKKLRQYKTANLPEDRRKELYEEDKIKLSKALTQRNLLAIQYAKEFGNI